MHSDVVMLGIESAYRYIFDIFKIIASVWFDSVWKLIHFHFYAHGFST